jgi:hypothetical protein
LQSQLRPLNFNAELSDVAKSDEPDDVLDNRGKKVQEHCPYEQGDEGKQSCTPKCKCVSVYELYSVCYGNGTK